MKEPIFIECKGCWKLVVLGFSNHTKRAVITDSDGALKAIVYHPLPAHDSETCQVCGEVYEFPPLDERRPADDEEFEMVTYRFGPPCWPENAEENLCLPNRNSTPPFSDW